jgi:hypothetical protein
MEIDRLAVAVRWVGLVESVAVIAAVNVPAAVGFPVMAPVDALIPNPPGRPDAVQVIGSVPPLAATVALYAVPTVPPGSDAVVMLTGATMVIDRFAVAVKCVGLVESVAVIDAVVVPAVVGFPVIAPVDALIPNPAGRPVAVQVIGGVPPVAATVPL